MWGGTNVYYGAILGRRESGELPNRSRPGRREDRPVAPRERVERRGARRDGEDGVVAVIVIVEPVHPCRVRRGGMRHRRHRRVNDGQQERERADELTGHTHRPYPYPRALVKKRLRPRATGYWLVPLSSMILPARSTLILKGATGDKPARMLRWERSCWASAR